MHDRATKTTTFIEPGPDSRAGKYLTFSLADEESAGAAEEYSAQAETVKDAVAELMRIVEGAREVAQTQTIRKPKPGPQTEKKAAAVVKPDNVIPLGEDFTDF